MAQEPDPEWDLELCPRCWAMTWTLPGNICGKCKREKK